MLTALRSLFRRHIAADVPDDLAACIECRARQCRHGDWINCPNRLAQAASLTITALETSAGASGVK